MTEVPTRIVEVAQQLKDGEIPRRYKVRAVLKWFGASRRGANVLSDIKTVLENLGLQTDPVIDVAKIDDYLRFVLASPASADTQGPSEQAPQSASVAGPGSTFSSANDGAPNGAVEAASDDQLAPKPEEEQPILKPDDSSRPVTSQSSDWTISVLRDKLDRGQLDLQPKFQREYVWNLRPELPSRLIESLLLEIPIPPIYFGKLKDGRLEMIDGQQRLRTLVDFVSNKFSLRKLARMGELNDKFFRDLAKPQQEKIMDTTIRSIVIDARVDMELRYEIFERLNRGSMTLNAQEVRNCIYRGPFNELLADLEKDSYWRKSKGGDEPERRFKEREVILRFFAFANRLPQYVGNLKHFLNVYMGKYAPKEPQELRALEALFRQTVQNVYAVFGEKAARLYEIDRRTNNGRWDSKFAVTAFDIQASALMNQPPAKVQKAAEQIREQFLFMLLTDDEMKDAIAKHTSGILQTRIRWSKFRELVDPIIAETLVEPRFFDFEFRKELYDKSPTCQLCDGNQIHTLDDSTVDHIIPYSKGGKTVRENGQLAHRSCNARKNNRQQ